MYEQSPAPMSASPPAPSRGPVVLAWLVIAFVCLAAIALPHLAPDPAEVGEDRIGLTIMQVQAQYLVGVSDWVGYREMLYRQAEDQLNRGTVPQRQRFVILTAELRDPAAARDALHSLNRLIEQRKAQQMEAEGEAEAEVDVEAQGEPDQPGFSLTENQRAVHALLHALYDHEEIDEPNVDALTQNDREFLRDELGWFGDLALAHPTIADPAERREVLRPAYRVVIVLVVSVSGFIMGLIAGLIALVVWVVLLLKGNVRLHYGEGAPHHGVYAETFAIWLALFFGLQLLPGLIPALGELGLMYGMIIFFGSLIVLGWPMVRGVPWSRMRKDTGLTLGPAPALEPFSGALGYIMALPVLVVGMVITLALMAIHAMFADSGDVFGPTGGPAHPIVSELAEGNWPARIQLFILAAVAAPIVEEIMFRGVFYRHMRDASRALGLFGSVAFSGLLNAFIFAAIHPQGLLAVPALMSLAIMFVLLREWRDTVIPAIVMHGISNAIIVTMLILAVSA